MVSDHFLEPFERKQKSIQDWFPGGWPYQQVIQNPSIAAEIAELRKLIADFREAWTAAKRVDELTAQPDCVDPKKATLVERVADLERRLDSLGV